MEIDNKFWGLKGHRVKLADFSKREYEHSGTIEFSTVMADRVDLSIKLSDGTSMVLMIMKNKE